MSERTVLFATPYNAIVSGFDDVKRVYKVTGTLPNKPCWEYSFKQRLQMLGTKIRS